MTPWEAQQIGHIAQRLRAATWRLRQALRPYQLAPEPVGATMPNPILDTLAADVTNATTVMDSAVALVNGIAARITAAVQAAIAGGATAAELAPVQAEADALTAKAGQLAAAVQANTPPPAGP